MTAIRLNLMIEEQLALKAEARNPVKVAIAIGVFLLTTSVITGLYMGHLTEKRIEEAKSLHVKLEELQALQAGMAGSDTKALKNDADDYLEIHQARTVFAPQMAMLKELVPDSIQLLAVRYSLAAEMANPPAPVVTEDKATKVKAPPKPTGEHLVMQMDGRTVCPRPEIEVDQFIKSLRAHPRLSPLIKEIRLRSIARAPTSGSGPLAVPSATFVIECEYKEVKK